MQSSTEVLNHGDVKDTPENLHADFVLVHGHPLLIRPQMMYKKYHIDTSVVKELSI